VSALNTLSSTLTQIRNRTTDAADLSDASVDDRPPVDCGGPYSSRLSALQQYLLGIQHGFNAAKFLCSMEDRIDVIPVDYCADALMMLLDNQLARSEGAHFGRRRK
jgi:hypothetical protein